MSSPFPRTVIDSMDSPLIARIIEIQTANLLMRVPGVAEADARALIADDLQYRFELYGGELVWEHEQSIRSYVVTVATLDLNKARVMQHREPLRQAYDAARAILEEHGIGFELLLEYRKYAGGDRRC